MNSTKTGKILESLVSVEQQLILLSFISNSPLRKLLEGRRTLDKNRWINSPNVYQKVEITEQGSQDPKKITKVVELPDTKP